jgi:N-acetyl-alpha-D-glucosaminyl L-malate synthase BshA
VITTLHGTDITLVGQESSFYAITKFSIEQSDEVTAVSAYLRDETYRAFGCVSCNIRVIPNFVNLQEYRPAETGGRSGLAPADHKVITTLHGTDITLVGQESSFYGITKFSIEQSDEVTAVSAYLRDETYRAFGCVSCDVKVIPNFVNLQEYRPGEPGAKNTLAPEGGRVITHVSNFREVKRVKDVVRVFARIQRAMPATLIMVGDGPERVDAENEARELGVTADVRFLGRLDSVASLLQATDLFLLPSQTESFGLAALEAMACGSPVVASRAGGLPEVIDDAVNGILEPVGSVEAMGRRAVELLRDPPRYAAMREAAVAKAREFSADRIVPMYEQVYEEVLRGRPAMSRADGR